MNLRLLGSGAGQRGSRALTEADTEDVETETGRGVADGR